METAQHTKELLRKVRLAIVLGPDNRIIGVLTRIDILDHVARVTAATAKPR